MLGPLTSMCHAGTEDRSRPIAATGSISVRLVRTRVMMLLRVRAQPGRCACANLVLRGELARIGRARTAILLDDALAVTLRDHDGERRGPAPAAFSTLVGIANNRGSGADFWSLFPR